MDIAKILSPTPTKLALALALLLVFFPFATFQAQLKCVQGTGCPITTPLLLSPAIAFLFQLMLGSEARALMGIDGALLLIGILFSYMIACTLAFLLDKHKK
jgi:ABC-type transport system involved in cytochrome c biogenesis permease component